MTDSKIECSSLVDRDQLKATYGQNVVSYMINTPEPNLDGSFVPAPDPGAYPSYAPEPQVAQTAAATGDPAVDLSQPPVQEPGPEAVAEAQTVQYDPSAVPPPADNVPPAQDLAVQPTQVTEQTPPQQAIESYADQPVQTPEPDTNEAMSEELSKVESSEQIANSDEPSAVYDSSTGELAIIHHHAAATSITSAANEPQTPIGNPTQQGAA